MCTVHVVDFSLVTTPTHISIVYFCMSVCLCVQMFLSKELCALLFLGGNFSGMPRLIVEQKRARCDCVCVCVSVTSLERYK